MGELNEEIMKIEKSMYDIWCERTISFYNGYNTFPLCRSDFEDTIEDVIKSKEVLIKKILMLLYAANLNDVYIMTSVLEYIKINNLNISEDKFSEINEKYKYMFS